MTSISKKALITGISGQDGSYLAEFLLQRGYQVYGTVRNLDSVGVVKNLSHIKEKIVLLKEDVSDFAVPERLIKEIEPDEIYHLASAVEAQTSFEGEFESFDINTSSTHHFLSAIKIHKPNCRFYLAGTSKIFGNPENSPQSETTQINPRSPYGISKATAFFLVRMYREVHGIFACTGILFNHESPRRDPRFLPRKVTRAAARIKLGLDKELRVGNLESRRDWGFAGDFVESMWLSLQAPEAGDLVIGTGVTHSVRELIAEAFGAVGLNWEEYVVVDKLFVQAPEKFDLVADISEAKRRINWRPRTTFSELIKMMIQEDLCLAETAQKNND